MDVWKGVLVALVPTSLALVSWGFSLEYRVQAEERDTLKGERFTQAEGKALQEKVNDIDMNQQLDRQLLLKIEKDQLKTQSMLEDFIHEQRRQQGNE